MQKIKPGFVTSEFFTVVAQIIFNFALAFGWVEANDSESTVEAIALLISSLVTAILTIRYIQGRTDLKKAQMVMEGAESKPELLK